MDYSIGAKYENLNGDSYKIISKEEIEANSVTFTVKFKGSKTLLTGVTMREIKYGWVYPKGVNPKAEVKKDLDAIVERMTRKMEPRPLVDGKGTGLQKLPGSPDNFSIGDVLIRLENRKKRDEKIERIKQLEKSNPAIRPFQEKPKEKKPRKQRESKIADQWIGLRFQNKMGYWFQVIDYVSNHNVTVRFDVDCVIVEKRESCNVKTGAVKHPTYNSPETKPRQKRNTMNKSEIYKISIEEKSQCKCNLKRDYLQHKQTQQVN